MSDERHGVGLAVGAAAVVAAVLVLLVVAVLGLGVRRNSAVPPEPEPDVSPPSRLVAPGPDAAAFIGPSTEAVLYDLDEGQLVVAHVRGFPPRARGALGFCDDRGCQPEQIVPIVTDGEGNTDVAYRLSSGCDAAPCALVVDVDAVRGSVTAVFGPRPAPVAVTVVRPAGPRPDVPRSQALFGLLLALVLGGVAVGLVRSTDWQGPTEAATPAMDAAELLT